MMNGREKSDSAVVATKPANNAGQPAAEWVEPRAGTKGNTGQPRTCRAQNRASVPQGLERVRQVARQRKKERFTALLHHVTIDRLRESFLALKRNAAPGVDGVTWRYYEAGLEEHLQRLHAQVRSGAYRALPVRRQYIPKPDGKQRRGAFQLQRKTRGDRMRAKLRQIKEELRRRMHEPIPVQGQWLRQVVRGYFAYHAVPTNSRALSAFRYHVTTLWRRTLRRRSQKDAMTWERMSRIANAWLPRPRILHPWPNERFAVKHPR
jgi:hypothetical protein